MCVCVSLFVCKCVLSECVLRECVCVSGYLCVNVFIYEYVLREYV